MQIDRLDSYLEVNNREFLLQEALAQDPQIYLMDEPLNGVDATTEETILSILEDLERKEKPL